MRLRSLPRALWIPCVLLALLAAGFIYPHVRYEFLTSRWGAQIRRDQDPEELRNWAFNLLALYSTNHPTWGFVTNRPPTKIPRSKYGPSVVLDWEESPHVRLVWGAGMLGAWGLEIGETNFIGDERGFWKAGIYFFRSP
jgi:hypothetical protein